MQKDLDIHNQSNLREDCQNFVKKIAEIETIHDLFRET